MKLSQDQKDKISVLLHRLNKTAGLHAEDYNLSIPEAMEQIESIIDDTPSTEIPAGVVTPKEKFIQDRLLDYEKYYNPAKKIFEIETGHEDPENNWTPTKDELIADLEKSWEFENGELR